VLGSAIMPLLSSNNNAVLFENCKNLQGLTATLNVVGELVTLNDLGFSLQLNSYPQPGSVSQLQPLNWFQYIIYVSGGQLWWEIQYWSLGGTGKWPPGYTPNSNTTPWLPVFANDYHLTSFGPAPSNRIPPGSSMQIALTTDSSGNVTRANFSVAGRQAAYCPRGRAIGSALEGELMNWPVAIAVTSSVLRKLPR
jgi:hypothetical protein